MSVVLLFEADVQPGRFEAYVNYSLEAQGALNKADGCESSEQLMSASDSRHIVVKSTWRDAASVERWQKTRGAELAQRAERLSIFAKAKVSILHQMAAVAPGITAAAAAVTPIAAAC